MTTVARNEQLNRCTRDALAEARCAGGGSNCARWPRGDPWDDQPVGAASVEGRVTKLGL